MPIPSIYLNLEDDITKIVQRVKREKATQLVLVCPKRCFLFNDSINLRLLKKQTDFLGKDVSILTMDELGQMYAKEAGFQLKSFPKPGQRGGISDIRPAKPVVRPEPAQPKSVPKEPEKPTVKEEVTEVATSAVSKLHNLMHQPSPAVKTEIQEAPVVEPPYEPLAEEPVAVIAQRPKKKSSLQHKFVISFVAVTLLVVVAVVFIVLPQATVAVYPKTEPITRDWDVGINTQSHDIDANAMTLPATTIAETLDEQNKFQSQGKQEIGNQATGTIQIYNFTSLPLNLRASTTVISLGNNKYYLTKDLTGVKPTTYKNATTKEVNPNSLIPPVPIIAEQGGDSYNVPAGTRLEITNQVLGPRPQTLFAKTVDPVTGGTSRFLSVITAADITSAQNSLAAQALSDLRAKLATQHLVLADRAFAMENLGFNTDQPVGTQTPSFNATLKAKITGMAFSMVDLENLITQRVGQTLGSDKTLQINNPDQQIGYAIKSIDLNSNAATMGVHFEGNAVMNVNLADVASELVGKNENQAQDLLLSNPQIDKIEITLAPSWQKTFPYFASKIKVNAAKP